MAVEVVKICDEATTTRTSLRAEGPKARQGGAGESPAVTPRRHMIQIIQDTREQAPLNFSKSDGVEIVVECLPVGDYGARIAGVMQKTVIERKSIADLFNSFSSGYENEKKKIERAKEMGLKYVLAIEGTAFDVREGHMYRRDGEYVASKKDGLSQCRQLMTMYRKGYFDIWWCRDRREMAFLIIEYFLVKERVKDVA